MTDRDDQRVLHALTRANAPWIDRQPRIEQFEHDTSRNGPLQQMVEPSNYIYTGTSPTMHAGNAMCNKRTVFGCMRS
jgi:hypothetical protein